jgi:hypothetical protein
MLDSGVHPNVSKGKSDPLFVLVVHQSCFPIVLAKVTFDRPTITWSILHLDGHLGWNSDGQSAGNSDTSRGWVTEVFTTNQSCLIQKSSRNQDDEDNAKGESSTA